MLTEKIAQKAREVCAIDSSEKMVSVVGEGFDRETVHAAFHAAGLHVVSIASDFSLTTDEGDREVLMAVGSNA